MTPRNKVLAVTKRTADLCATQSLLYGAGFELITATNMDTACALIRVLPICGVIVCHDSWTEAERETMAAELKGFQLPMMRCPGCTGCDEANHQPGKLTDLVPLAKLMGTFGKAPH